MLFFVATSKEKLDIKLTNQYTNGLGNMKLILSKVLNQNKKEYIQNVYSIDFKIEKKLEIDNSTGQNIISLRLQINKSNSIRKDILFYKIAKKKNYFIYDFKCNDNKHNISVLKLKKYQQFNLFKDAIFNVNSDNNNNNIKIDLLEDSINNLVDSNKKFSLEFFIELLNAYYNKNEVNYLLQYLGNNLDYIYECEKLNSNYRQMLQNLEEKFEKNFLNKSMNSINCENMEIFSNLLFIYRTKFEKETIQEMMIERQIDWGFYSKIIVKKIDFYLNLGLIFPKDLINKMLKQDYLTLDTTIKLLSFGNSIEDILKMIINSFFKLSESCIKNKFKIIMTNFNKQKNTDNLEELINLINTIINNELRIKCHMVIFDEKFWLFYLNYYKNMKNFKKLKLIEKAILNCKRVDYNLDIFKFSKIIHENEINMIKSGELKNDKILDFFQKNYIRSNQNNNNIYFPLFFLEGINLETVNENFFNKWRQMNMISYINYDIYEFCKIIIDTINNFENFGKFFKFFGYDDSTIIKAIKHCIAFQPGITDL